MTAARPGRAASGRRSAAKAVVWLWVAAAVWTAGCAALDRRAATPEPRARNVILFIGDGLGLSAYTAARIWKVGATGRLAIDSLPHAALCSTQSHTQVVTDSAAAATAILSGVKTRNDALGEGPDAIPGSGTEPHAGQEGTPVQSIAELAAARGLATGVVTTTRVTHATPAAAYAHVRHRDLEDDIAAQLLAPVFGNPPPSVILGGGRRHFLPSDAADPEHPELHGSRTDGRNLAGELSARGYTYVWNAHALAALGALPPRALLGLFESSHMQFEADRTADAGGEPSLAEMTELAIRILAGHPAGYFLLVEGGRIDHALHVNNVRRALEETAMLDDAVARALAMTDERETLLVVTADHSHGLTLTGDAMPAIARRNVGDGEEDVAATRENLLGAGGADIGLRPFPALLFATGPGAIEPRPVGPDRPAMYPLPFGLHAGEDVFVAARGPGAERVRGFMTNTAIYHVMRRAYGF